jgi:lipoprotein-anchoring transpeptidase ErfK/SrfK
MNNLLEGKMNLNKKTMRKVGLAGIVAALASAPFVVKGSDIASELKSDIQSELTRVPTEGRQKGIFSTTTIAEHLKTIRDLGLYTLNDTFDGRPEYDLVVDKTTNQMEIYLNGELVRRMRVASGQILQPNKTRFGEYVTPNGNYVYINFKNINDLRREFGPNASYYGAGMLQLSGPWAPHIAIHGTNSERSIGTYSTNGCIRVSNADLEWLANNLGIGSRIRVYQSNPNN